MSKVITVTYCGMRGEGPTVKAAKLDATRKIEEMINEDWTPHMIVSGSWIVIVTKAPSDYGAHWGHRILKLDEQGSRTFRAEFGGFSAKPLNHAV